MRALTVPNLTAWAITLLALVCVAAWAFSPVSHPLIYRLGTAGQPRAVLSPRYVPASYDGFSAAEPWGRWTVGPTAAVVFGRPLTRAFQVELTARAFGPNVGVPIRLCAAEDCETVVLRADDSAVTAAFHTRGHARRLVIHVPHPAAPGPADTRLLGVGVVSLKVEAR